MKLTDVAPALVMLGLAATMVIGTASLDVWDGFTAGPAFFPALIAIFTTILAALLILRAWRGEVGEDVQWPDRAVLRTVGSTYGALVGFLVLTPVLGMIPAIMTFLAVVMIGVLRQPLLGSLAAVGITTGLIYIIFVRWLALPLPTGILGF
jgi:putative tricarboxylic transport membrane protein